MTSVSVRGKRECGETHRGDGHVKMEVKTEKRGHNPRDVEAAIQRRKRQGMYSPPRTLRREVSPARFGASSLQNFKRIKFYCFKPSNL